MHVLVLSHDDVLAALSPEERAEAMASVLAAHARGEAYMPLRSAMAPPGAAGFMGLMPGWRGAHDGASATFGLKAICLMPRNPARGLDAHQGFVTLFDGEIGAPTAILDASAVTRIRTAAVSAVATRLLAREDARVLAILGAGVQARAHLEALVRVRPFESVRIYAPTQAHAQELVGSVTPDAAGEFQLAVGQGVIPGEDHVRAELGELLAGTAPGRERRGADPVSLARAGGRGPRRSRTCCGDRQVQRPWHGGRAVIELAAIEAARERIKDVAIHTPLVRLPVEDAPAEIHLKLETLQPIGSFKIRGAANAILSAPEAALRNGLVTASAGNMAQGVACAARELGLEATIAVPDHAPEAKLAAIERLGGRVLKLPYDEWWSAIVTSRVDGVDGLFVHPVQDEGVMAGNGTIGLEILEDLPDPRRDRDPVRGRRLDRRDRERDPLAAAADEDLHGRARNRRRAGRGAQRRRPDRGRIPLIVRGRVGKPPRARRGGARARRRPGRTRRVGEHRMHRLGRKHQPGQAGGDPRRR